MPLLALEGRGGEGRGGEGEGEGEGEGRGRGRGRGRGKGNISSIEAWIYASRTYVMYTNSLPSLVASSPEDWSWGKSSACPAAHRELLRLRSLHTAEDCVPLLHHRLKTVMTFGVYSKDNH